MGLTLFLFMLVLITVQCRTSQEHIMSTEDINVILDKLILQTKQNETDPIRETNESFISTVDPQPGNDSNIYYFKTYMAPSINYKSSNEMLHDTRRSNNTDRSSEADNQDLKSISDEESFPDTNRIITRKSLLEIENQKHAVPRIIVEEQENPYTEYRTGDIDENDVLDDLLKKEIVSDFQTMKDNKQISFTQHTQQNQQLNILRNYPEIIIDHITYDNDENDKEFKNRLIKIKAAHDVQHVQNVVKGDKNIKLVNSLKPALKTRFSIPEEDIEIVNRNLPEQFKPKNYLTPEMKVLIEAIVQKKVLHENLFKQNTESESRKQSLLLEKILQKLPENMQTNNNAKASYSLQQEIISPTEIKTLSQLRSSLESLHRNIGHHLTNPYLTVPAHLPHKWELHNRLLATLLRLSRPKALKQSRVRAGIIDRILSNIDYQPVYYDLYKK